MANTPRTGVAIPRSTPESLRASELSASLTVKDLEKSVAWYRDVVGFTIDRRHERDGKLMGVSLKAGLVRILLNQDDGARGLDRAKGEGFSLQITTSQSIDAIANRIKAAGGTLASEPADMPWGVRSFRVVDPDGFRLAFSSERAPG
jgi:lactoylglutathione lyase